MFIAVVFTREVKTTQESMDGMKKQNVVYTDNGLLFSVFFF